MKPLRQDPRPVQQAPHPQRLRQQPVLIREQFSDEEEGEYVMPQHLHPRQFHPQEDLATPLSVEFEELPWPPRFNPTILPQFDGDSDPKDFLLKYEAAIEASGGGVACKVKAFVLPRTTLVLKPPGRTHPHVGPAPKRAHRCLQSTKA